ncbi:MAG: fluoride efflux transporter CrcB [Ottowia sp.]|nr:fluoride efflux transporter CrcB [Ottowia sp.]
MGGIEFIGIGVGAALGAWLRWWLGVSLSHVLAAMPLGTLCANGLGGFLIGCVLAYSADYAGFSPAWRLFIVTGFLGGLTTFSSFSAESFSLFQSGRVVWACLHSIAHVGGSFVLCALGYALVKKCMGE